jgi:hypothetical protein
MYTVYQRVLNDLLMTRLYRNRMIWLLAHPLTPVSQSDPRHTGRLRNRDHKLTGVVEGGLRGAGSSDRKKVWSSINHSILSAVYIIQSFL